MLLVHQSVRHVAGRLETGVYGGGNQSEVSLGRAFLGRGECQLPIAKIAEVRDRMLVMGMQLL